MKIVFFTYFVNLKLWGKIAYLLIIFLIFFNVNSALAYRNVEDAISWAEDQIGDNWDEECGHEWAWWCLHFVGHAYDVVPAGFSDAITAWNDNESTFGHRQNSIPPRGALVFFEATANNNWLGHVGLCIGNGTMIHAWTTGVRKDPVSFGGEFLGWRWPISWTSDFPVCYSVWARTYGGNQHDRARSIEQTNDGGYIIAGSTESFGAGGSDFWILKLTSTGVIEWQFTYGGSNEECANSIKQTTDGGYIVAGYTRSFDAGYYNFWILKLTSTGVIEWQRVIGAYKNEITYSIQQTMDGGYIVGGYSDSFGIYAGLDFWILKLNPNGDIDWQKNYEGGWDDRVISIQQTSDNGYIVAGSTDSFVYGNLNFWVIKLSSTGGTEWQKVYEASLNDKLSFVQQTSEGGYIIIGSTNSYGAGAHDFWVIKLSSTGEIEWQRVFGGSNEECANSIKQTTDGGYIVAGSTRSFGNGFYDILILKLDSSGLIEWERTYGGTSEEEAYSIKQTNDGGYIVAGYTSSFGAGFRDFLILKLDQNGDIDPLCGLTGISNATVSDTSVSPQDTDASIEDTNATVRNTYVTPENTNATVEIICEAKEYSLTISATIGGTTDPGQATYIYDSGVEVNITAIPDSNYRFSGWTGDVPSGHENDNPLSISMDSDKSITAYFIRQYTLTIVAGTGGTTNPSPGEHTHDSGAQVSITAVPNSGYQFSGWSGGASGTSNPTSITMDSDKSITASFSSIPDPTDVNDSDSAGGKKCFIATAAYGSPLHPYVEILRFFRDKYLMANKIGRKLVGLYYKYSPSLADLIAKHKVLKVIVRTQLVPLVALSYMAIHFGSTVTTIMFVLIFAISIFSVSFYRKKKQRRAEARLP